MSTVVKVALGVVLGLMVLIVGCVAIIGVGVDQAAEEFERQQERQAVSNSDVRALDNGMSRQEVIGALGKPRSTDESNIQGLGRSTCIYYGVEGDALGQWQLCFDGQGRLEHRSRL